MQNISTRKLDHIKYCLDNLSTFKNKTTGFENIELIHNALPEISLDEVDTSITFCKKLFSMPLMIAPITGGSEKSEQINYNLAKAANKAGIGMALGSMKAVLKDPFMFSSYDVRPYLGDNFLAANIGANDLNAFSHEQIISMCEKLDVDALGIHLNSAQELVQPEGKTDFRGVLKHIKSISKEFPVYVREVSSGISGVVAEKLIETSIFAIDVGGAGGTSWTAVEYLRQGKTSGLFWDWGIPTAKCVFDVAKVVENYLSINSIQIIATGGIRNGLDCVKAISLGANLCGVAAPFLKAEQNGGWKNTFEYLQKLKNEIASSMFLIGAKNILSIKDIVDIKNV